MARTWTLQDRRGRTIRLGSDETVTLQFQGPAGQTEESTPRSLADTFTVRQLARIMESERADGQERRKAAWAIAILAREASE